MSPPQSTRGTERTLRGRFDELNSPLGTVFQSTNPLQPAAAPVHRSNWQAYFGCFESVLIGSMALVMALFCGVGVWEEVRLSFALAAIIFGCVGVDMLPANPLVHECWRRFRGAGIVLPPALMGTRAPVNRALVVAHHRRQVSRQALLAMAVAVLLIDELWRKFAWAKVLRLLTITSASASLWLIAVA